MTLRDWIELAVLAVLTLTGIGRWVEARERRETHADEQGSHVQRALAQAEHRHEQEHERIWQELERMRDHWQREFTPWQQKISERISVQESHLDGHSAAISRLDLIVERRFRPRD